MVIWEALGFFKGSGNVFPLSVDLSKLCRSFSVESNTTIEIYIVHDNLSNEKYHVIERNRLLEFMTKIWFKIEVRPQERTNWKLCRIIRIVLVFTAVVHRFMQRREKLCNFDNMWTLNSDRRQVLMKYFANGWVRWVAGKRTLLLLRSICEEWDKFSE